MKPILPISEGYKTPIRRYQPYFPSYILRTLKECNPNDVDVVLVHSIGLVNCLCWCKMNNVKPKIIAMDPSSILSADVTQRILDNNDLTPIFETYESLKINPADYEIVAFHPERLKDKQYPYKTVWYTQDTHYPYMISSLRDKIVKELKN